MVLDQLKLFVALYRRPAAAMSAIVDQGSLLFGVAATLLTSLLSAIPARLPPNLDSPWLLLSPGSLSFYTPLLLLAALVIPALVAAAKIFGQQGSFNTLLQRDYAALLTCLTFGWAAAHLPVAAIEWAVGRAPLLLLLGLGLLRFLIFAVLAVFAIRVIYGVSYGAAIGIAAISAGAFSAGVFLYGAFGFLLRFLASPFVLFYGYRYFSGEFQTLGRGLSSRQNFRRILDAATLNPHDADAQYQLGIIYQQRRQPAEAVQRFENAVAIDPREPDALFQLGKIAREQARNDEALAYLERVVDIDPKHGNHEVWRELGALHLTLGHLPEARQCLDYYAKQRPYDPEGLYYFGEVLTKLGETAAAQSAYRQCIEAVRTAPSFRRRSLQPWARLAQKAL